MPLEPAMVLMMFGSSLIHLSSGKRKFNMFSLSLIIGDSGHGSRRVYKHGWFDICDPGGDYMRNQ